MNITKIGSNSKFPKLSKKEYLTEPCPVCGAPAEFDYLHGFMLFCTVNCFHNQPAKKGLDDQDVEAVVKDWNDRAYKFKKSEGLL